jgi:hypothetical protein
MTALRTSPRSWLCDRCGATAAWDYQPDPSEPDSIIEEGNIDGLGFCPFGWYAFEMYESAGCPCVNEKGEAIWGLQYVGHIEHDNDRRWHLCRKCFAALQRWMPAWREDPP